jgi:hypothetical protein
VVGGESHIAIKEAATSDRWNLHLHALIELAATAPLPKAPLVRAWQKILQARGVAGSADLRPVSRPGVVWRHMKPFSPLTYYTTRRQRGLELRSISESAIRAGRLPAVKIGRAVRVRADAQIGEPAPTSSGSMNTDTPRARAARILGVKP